MVVVVNLIRALVLVLLSVSILLEMIARSPSLTWASSPNGATSAKTSAG